MQCNLISYLDSEDEETLLATESVTIEMQTSCGEPHVFTGMFIHF